MSLLAGRYRTERVLATGGMGEVWLATDETLGREVAVKLLHADVARDKVFAARFREEARHLARISHPAIVAVYDFGEDDRDPYLVMEYVAGRTLAQLLRDEGAQSAGFVRDFLGQCADALAVAHAAGIVHRDIKPSNILVTADGHPKLTDFGIARMLTGSGLTRTGEVLGTPQYLSPEQAAGGAADARSDIYALALVGFEMLTGTRAFDRSTPVETALAQLNDPPPHLPPDTPEDLAMVIGSCLAKDPGRRPASAGMLSRLLAELEERLDGTLGPRPGDVLAAVGVDEGPGGLDDVVDRLLVTLAGVELGEPLAGPDDQDVVGGDPCAVGQDVRPPGHAPQVPTARCVIRI